MEESSEDRAMLLEFLEAAAEGNVEEVRRRLDCDPTLVNTQHPESGDTALILAAQHHHLEVLAVLLERGADVTVYNVSDQTALHVADTAARDLLLAAVHRPSFPHLCLAQAAWQGDLDTMLHLMSTEHVQDVNTSNSQGLSLLMLVVRGVDLFDGLATETPYRPVAVLEELLRRHGDAHLVDSQGRSAMGYACQVKSAMRQQLIAMLEKPPPPAETLEDHFGDCPDRETTVCQRPPSRETTVCQRPPSRETTECQRPPSRQDRTDEEHGRCRSQLECDNASGTGLNQEPTPEVDLVAKNVDLESPLVNEEKDNTMDKRKKNSLSGQWHVDFMSEHLTPRSSIKRHPSLPPLQGMKDEKDAQLERLGLGYLLQGSFSEPDLSEQFAVDRLQNIRHIKEHIRQRLSSAESSEKSKTFPPISYSPRSSNFIRLQPLMNISAKKNRTDRPSNVHTSEVRDKTRDYGLVNGQSNVQAPERSSENVSLSKDLIQISVVSLASIEGSNNHNSDPVKGGAHLSESNHVRIKTREESVNCDRFRPLHSSRQSGEQADLGTGLLQKHNYESRLNTSTDDEENDMVMNSKTEAQEHKTDTLNDKQNISMGNNDITVGNEKLHDVSKIIESMKMNSPRSPRASYVPCIQITFSETKQEKEIIQPLSKHLVTKKNLNFLTSNACQSFNILAQKENNRCKKTKKVRNNSAPKPATKHTRPLTNSNENFGKGDPLPALVYSSSPSLSKKGSRSKPNSAERSGQRSQTQLSLYAKNRLNSPIHPVTPPRAKTSHDFQGISYTDMLFEMKPQDNGPQIYQIFETPAYNNSSTDITRGPTAASSASSKRSGSSKSIRSVSSRNSSAKAPKKTKQKKSSSAKKQKNTLTKPITSKDVSERIGVNSMATSGSDQEIKTRIQEGRFHLSHTQSSPEINHHIFSDLSIIKEASIENSLSLNKARGVTQSVMQHGHIYDLNCDQEYDKGDDKVSYLTKNEENNVQDLKTTGPPQDTQKSLDRLSEQQLQDRSTIIDVIDGLFDGDDQEAEESLHNVYSFSQTLKNIHKIEPSEQLTDELILEYAKLIEEHQSSKTQEDLQDLDQQDAAEEPVQESPNEEQISRCSSVNDSISNTDHSVQMGNNSESNNGDGSIHWIKGEVLGRGAYGTVYCGLTSQGELIAAKQVMLHGSDPAVAEKEYKKLQEEVDLLKTLKHDNIVGYLGTCLQDHIVTIFMEFVPGGSISSILRHFGPLQEVVISKYTNHILQGIAYLHKNRVVHRDIKGNNVMLMPSGVIKLIDFGCAKRLNGLNMNGTRGEMLKSMHGTPYWMAPEVISESGHGVKSDIWSIGCTVFEMATGKPPLAHMNKMAAMFYIAEHKGLMPTLPNHFSKKARDFVNLCLIREQEERPSAELLLQHPFISRKT